MLDLRRLRLLHELHARGTIAKVADALQFTPSAVSQQLAVLEREAGAPLLERAGRGVRLTDAALVLVGHAEALLQRAELAEAELAAVTGTVAGRARIAAFQSVARRIAAPAMKELADTAPGLRCELLEAEPEDALPALALGDVDLVLGDEWQHAPHPRPEGLTREDLARDAVQVVLPAGHPAARSGSLDLGRLARESWATGHRGTAWEEMTIRACRELGGFDPDIRHRTNDSVLTLALVADGQAVTLLPDFVRPEAQPGVVARPLAGGGVFRTLFAATRSADAERPSVQALVAAVRRATEAARRSPPAATSP